MLRPNITKFAGFVILEIAVLFAAACSPQQKRPGTPPTFAEGGSTYQASTRTGTLRSDDVRESSGLAASLCQAGVYWTINDSGGGPFVFAIDETGKELGTWRVPDVENIDWEAIAVFRKGEKCSVLIGEIGNSKDGSRTEHRIYSIAEPIIDATSSGSTKKKALMSSAAATVSFSYPDRPHDAEAMMVHPNTGDIYVVTKERKQAAAVFRVRPSAGQKIVAEKIGEVSLPAVPEGMITDGSISPDGTRLALTDYFAGYEFTLPAEGGEFSKIFEQKPAVVEIGIRDQGEALTYSADGKALLATSEGKDQPIMKAVRTQ